MSNFDFSNFLYQPTSTPTIFNHNQQSPFNNHQQQSQLFSSNNHPITSNANTLSSQFQQIRVYNDLYNYATNTLKTLGFILGILPYSLQNNKTITCILELIRLRQKDVESKKKLQQQILKIQFESNASRSTLERTLGELQNYRRMLGSLENKSQCEQIKLKSEIQKLTNEKAELYQQKIKMEQKVNQSIHEIKKRDIQITKLKDNLIKKLPEKGSVKNGFDVSSCLTSNIEKKQYQLISGTLKQKYEYQRSIYSQQNRVLRQQIQQYSNYVLQFLFWLNNNYKLNDIKKDMLFYNHNLIFKKQSISEELKSNIEIVKKYLIIALQSKQSDSNKQNCQTIKKLTIDLQQNNNQLKLRQVSSNKNLIKSSDFSSFKKPFLKSTINKDLMIGTPKQKRSIKQNLSQLSLISHISIKDLHVSKKIQKWDINCDDE